jgi:hypothetical protein
MIRTIILFLVALVVTYFMYTFVTTSQTKVTSCRMSNWSKWTKCQDGDGNLVKCGGGYEMRTRTILQQNRQGETCPTTKETRPCNQNACDKNCEMTEWSAWSECDTDCGGGQQYRTRHVKNLQTGKGSCNQPVIQYRQCNSNLCVSSCNVGSWGLWSKCTDNDNNLKTCGGGFKTRIRSVNSNVGRTCPVNKQTIPCNNNECPKKCIVSGWSDWSDCTESCGEAGVQTRTRTVQQYPFGDNNFCPKLIDTKKCNRVKCDQDCQVSNWSDWTKCTDKNQSSTREIVHNPSGDKKCPPLIKYQPCQIQEDVDCVIGPYYTSGCSKVCGGGTQNKTSTITQFPIGNGKKCPPLLINEKCNDNLCPVDCKVGNWNNWSVCSDGDGNHIKCGDGVQNRNRHISQKPLNGGVSCPSLEESKTCKLNPCPINCKVKYKSQWYGCDATCDRAGQEKRDWNVDGSKFGGIKCESPCQDGVCQETKICAQKKCPRDCEYSSWKDKNKCASCGINIYKTQTREILKEAVNGGIKCTEELSKNIPCPGGACKNYYRVIGQNESFGKMWYDSSKHALNFGLMCSYNVSDDVEYKDGVVNKPSGNRWKEYSDKKDTIGKTTIKKCSPDKYKIVFKDWQTKHYTLDPFNVITKTLSSKIKNTLDPLRSILNK